MILVAGATGVLGGRIVRRLLEEQHPVRVLVRDVASGERMRLSGAEVVKGDLRRPDTLRSAIRGVAAVVDTANATRQTESDAIDMVDRRGAMALVDAAHDEGIEQFVYVSARGASPDSASALLRAKAAVEEHLQKSGVPATILRPDRFMESWIGAYVATPVRAGRAVTIAGDGERRSSFVAVADVAAIAVAVIGNPAAIGRVITFGGPEALSWLDIVEYAADALGRVVPVRHIAEGAPLPGMPDTVAQIAADLERSDSVLDSTQLATDLGVELTSARDWLRAHLRER